MDEHYTETRADTQQFGCYRELDLRDPSKSLQYLDFKM